MIIARQPLLGAGTKRRQRTKGPQWSSQQRTWLGPRNPDVKLAVIGAGILLSILLVLGVIVQSYDAEGVKGHYDPLEILKRGAGAVLGTLIMEWRVAGLHRSLVKPPEVMEHSVDACAEVCIHNTHTHTHTGHTTCRLVLAVPSAAHLLSSTANQPRPDLQLQTCRLPTCRRWHCSSSLEPTSTTQPPGQHGLKRQVASSLQHQHAACGGRRRYSRPAAALAGPGTASLRTQAAS
jgi:hypothetical protein